MQNMVKPVAVVPTIFKIIRTMTKKNIKTKPAFIVNLTDIECPEDVVDAFVRAKINAGVPITMNEYESTISSVIKLTIEAIEECQPTPTVINDDKLFKKLTKILINATKKKDPWYKRAWNWVKKPFCKKK